MLTPAQRDSWELRGYFVVPRFAPSLLCDAMLARAIEIARLAAGGNPPGRALVTAEAKPNPTARNPEERVSKIFRCIATVFSTNSAPRRGCWILLRVSSTWTSTVS